jgi:lipid-binding SYLF domain-containing protein
MDLMTNSNRALLVLFTSLLVGGCSSTPFDDTQRKNVADESIGALREMKSSDQTLGPFLDQAYGYAIFPAVGKGGLIAGGAHGYGVVYEQDQLIGYSELTQASIGGQIGGQTYSELVVFESKDALQRFNSGKVTFQTSVSAVALDQGTAKGTHYIDGVAVFLHPTGGLMAEAVIGGQQFTFMPK